MGKNQVFKKGTMLSRDINVTYSNEQKKADLALPLLTNKELCVSYYNVVAQHINAYAMGNSP